MLGSNFYPRTLQESATIRTSHRRQHRLYFNPRTLQESATQGRFLVGRAASISIHAPYKRVRPQP